MADYELVVEMLERDHGIIISRQDMRRAIGTSSVNLIPSYS